MDSMKTNLFTVLLILTSLTACLNESEESEESRVEKAQTPVGEWLSDCIENEIPGLFGSGGFESVGAYKVERIAISQDNFEKTIDYYEDEQCVNFLSRDEVLGSYDVPSYASDVIETSENYPIGVTAIKFIVDCTLDCDAEVTDHYSTGSRSGAGVIDQRIMMFYYESSEYYSHIEYSEVN